MDEELLAQIQTILQNHRGRRNPISSSQIAQTIGIIEDDTHSATRNLIYQCAQQYRIPLVATSNGYFIIENEEELNCYIANLESRVAGIQERIRFIQETWRAQHNEI